MIFNEFFAFFANLPLPLCAGVFINFCGIGPLQCGSRVYGHRAGRIGFKYDPDKPGLVVQR